MAAQLVRKPAQRSGGRQLESNDHQDTRRYEQTPQPQHELNQAGMRYATVIPVRLRLVLVGGHEILP
ncbi:MAG: hypothetical protein KDB17_04260, partial [Ilumatobacter sp.]|nr:hypothetical protein [Ilumatobacter sp.]